MPAFNRFMAIVMAVAMLGPLPSLQAKTHKGDRYLAEGRAHEERKEWDAALESYEKALSEDPTDLAYQMAAQKARFEASAMHLANGQKIRAQGQLGEALLEFQKAYALSPSTTAAEQEILNTQEMIRRERLRVEQTGKQAPPEVRGLTPSEEAKKEVDDRVNRLLPAPELKPPRTNRIDFKINGTTAKTIFDTIALSAGLNPPLYDPEYLQGPATKDKLDININNLTVEEALDYVSLRTKSFWQPVNDTTIFVTMDNQNKRRDYEQEVTKIFYLTNVTNNTDLTAMITVLRTIADFQRLMPFDPQNAIIAKGPADRIALAEKIIHDLDKPRPEVVIDVYVVEASSVFMRSLAAGPFATGVNLAANFTPRASIQVQEASTTTTSSTTTSTSTTSVTTPGTTTTGTTPGSTTTGAAVPLSHIGQVNAGDWSTVLPGAVFTATLSDTRTKVLQSPQLRCVDNGKATMKIGEKEPTASGSFQPGLGGVAGAGISPLVNTQFTYLDVGVNVEVTPRIHENHEVSMHISIDISSVTGQVNLGGINEPIIGQRKVDQDVRLRDGEVSLIGGLLNVQDNTVKTGVPGLSSVPLIGKLFSGNSVDRERDEIMIALIPHIVRAPNITPEMMRAIATGTQSAVTVRRAPPAAEPVSQPPADNNPAPAGESAARPPAVAPGVPAGNTPPAAGAPPVTAPPVPPQPEPGAIAPPATAPPENTATTTTPANAARPATPGGPAKIHFDQAQVEKNAGESFEVALQVEDARDVSSAPINLQYDPKILSLDEIAFGKFWSADGEEPLLIKNVQNETGMASIRISRKPGSAAIAGTGTMLTLKFKALAKGTATVSATNITLNNSQNQMVGSGTPKLTVNVK